MKNIICISFLLFAIAAQSQSYRVYLKDKAFRGDVITASDVALSPKAIERRKQHHIPLDITDVPVNTSYIQAIRAEGGMIKSKVRWFNYVSVEGLSRETLEGLPFVQKVEEIEKYKVHFASTKSTQALNYGNAANQIQMLQGHKLHDAGFLGDSMVIAVIDGGFSGVEINSIFDDLMNDNRILGTYNFEINHFNVYTGGSHGATVLSTMGAYESGNIIGTAPKASYWLLKSEVESSETPSEMDNWAMAAEFADSVGADIINSSLGYSQFDDASKNYVYADMDGETTIVTKAADMAFQKGILVIVSAGNEGGNSWGYITAPGDSKKALTIGAVDASGQRAGFSSHGPSYDGRIKPDVMALGQAAAVSSSGSVFFANGTSYSSPIIAGMAACLWQVNPSLSNTEIKQQILESSNRYFTPDNMYGYGIPNFELAFQRVGLEQKLKTLAIDIYPIPLEEKLHIRTSVDIPLQAIEVSILDISGIEVYRSFHEGQDISIDFPYGKGVYIVKLTIGDDVYIQKVLK